MAERDDDEILAEVEKVAGEDGVMCFDAKEYTAAAGGKVSVGVLRILRVEGTVVLSVDWGPGRDAPAPLLLNYEELLAGLFGAEENDA